MRRGVAEWVTAREPGGTGGFCEPGLFLEIGGNTPFDHQLKVLIINDLASQEGGGAAKRGGVGHGERGCLPPFVEVLGRRLDLPRGPLFVRNGEMCDTTSETETLATLPETERLWTLCQKLRDLTVETGGWFLVRR